ARARFLKRRKGFGALRRTHSRNGRQPSRKILSLHRLSPSIRPSLTKSTVNAIRANIFFRFYGICVILRRFPVRPRHKERLMVEDKARARRRRLGAHGMMFRRRRIFGSLREGFTYDEIAADEGVSPSRIRQIVSKELQHRAVDSGAEHAKLQLDRLAPAIQLAAEAMAGGDISAITPYLKAL